MNYLNVATANGMMTMESSYYTEPMKNGPPLSCSQAPKGLDCCCCKRCKVGGCDLKVLDCGCCFHTRCLTISDQHQISACPVCQAPFRTIWLMPMSFCEIDEAKEVAAKLAPSGKRGKKRKNATIARLNPATTTVNHGTSSGSLPPAEEKSGGETSDLRTGRWTTEETAYCDELIEKFERGLLPIVDGIKLNDFLSNMLKSKQSRLTKKMKNARLSARCYKKTLGFIQDDAEARTLSEAESAFFDSIPCSLEKAEIKFHMQKEWRELYSNYCVSIGQTLDANAWLSSVEELDRRASEAKDAARMARRKVMMGHAWSQDTGNSDKGVFIEPHIMADSSAGIGTEGDFALAADTVDSKAQDNARARSFSSSPFVKRVAEVLQQCSIPFEHVDAWVPSFVPQQPGDQDDPGTSMGEHTCRLCYAGSATTEVVVPPNGGPAIPVTSEEYFDLISFGEYSQKFSFDLGCGLPGRVYSSGVASWEQGIQKAPSTLFERCGGALQWQIQTVLGIPIPSPNVGRVVVVLYSRHDRPRDQDVVNRVADEISKLVPTPKWKLVVDIGSPSKSEIEQAANIGGKMDSRVNDLHLLMRTYTPADKSSPFAVYLPGFTSLRLLLEKLKKTQREDELAQILIESYSSYCRSGKSPHDVAWMAARDYMLLSQNQPQQIQRQMQQHHNQQHSFSEALTGLQDVGTSPFAQASHESNIHQQSFQQVFSSAPAPLATQTQQHQQNHPLAPQQSSQSFDFSQQLPGQPSA